MNDLYMLGMIPGDQEGASRLKDALPVFQADIVAIRYFSENPHPDEKRPSWMDYLDYIYMKFYDDSLKIALYDMNISLSTDFFAKRNPLMDVVFKEEAIVAKQYCLDNQNRFKLLGSDHYDLDYEFYRGLFRNHRWVKEKLEGYLRQNKKIHDTLIDLEQYLVNQLYDEFDNYYNYCSRYSGDIWDMDPQIFLADKSEDDVLETWLDQGSVLTLGYFPIYMPPFFNRLNPKVYNLKQVSDAVKKGEDPKVILSKSTTPIYGKDF